MVNINWGTDPSPTTLTEDMFTQLRARDEHVAVMDYTGDTSIVANTKRYNESTSKFEKYDGTSAWNTLGFHTAIDAHIANAAIHASVPIGAILMYGGAINGNNVGATQPPPSGYFWCDGTTQNRSGDTGNLFAVIGTTFGTGNGTTTYNLPNFVQRFPIGTKTGTTNFENGNSGGAINHTHMGGAHQHQIATHVHAFDHSHTGGSHQHTLNDHQHQVQGHYHSCQGGGADIQITSSGSHGHKLRVTHLGTLQVGSNPTVSSGNLDGDNPVGGNPAAIAVESTSNHGHPHANVTGRVGNVTPGRDGDTAFLTAGVDGGAGSTQSGGAVATTGITVNISGSGTNTGGSGTLTTSAASAPYSGGVVTDGANPPYLCVNFIIKY